MSADPGPCRGSFLRYAYNTVTGRCEAFNYGGCRGNRNNFIKKSQCMAMCDEFNNASTARNEFQVQDNDSIV